MEKDSLRMEKDSLREEVKVAMIENKKITIKLKKGIIACPSSQRATVNGLGLKRRGQVRSLENTPSVRGMIKKVMHLLEIVSQT